MSEINRTGIDFSKYEVIVKKSEEVTIHHLKKPNTYIGNIKFINTNGILAVTGDYGNWIFCREFHPSHDGMVSSGYWIEKLRNTSSQEPSEFDEEGTREDINELLDKEEDLTDQEKYYLNECLEKLGYDEFDYIYFAHRENCGRFQDQECVPHRKKIKYWLEAVFDGFEEMCKRMKLDFEKSKIDL